jgi:hypothetical protein
VTFGADGSIVRTYTDAANAGLNRRGFYIFNENTILITVPEVETQQLRYLLLGDSLLLSDMNLQNPVTFTRVTAPPPPQGLDPAFLGTWAGYGDNGYFEFTFFEGNAYRKLVLPDETLSGEGTASFANGVLTLSHTGGAETYDAALSGDTLSFGAAIAARRQPGPLVREPLPEAQASAGMDAAITGVWGGMAEGRYQEFAFLPDGRFLGFSPLADPDQDSGNCLASGGSLAILSLRATAQGTYALEGDRLTLSLSGREPFTLQKKDGLLRRDARPAPQP